MKAIQSIIVLLTVLFLTACGQKGPLYFPPPPAEAASTQTAAG